MCTPGLRCWVLAIQRARLRGVHLNAHLEQAALLTPGQLTRYAVLRGYESNKHPGH